MKNTFKKLLLLIPLIGVLTGCGTPNRESESVEKEIKVEEIYFDLLSDKVYVDHYVLIKDFEVLPLSVTNKNVTWRFEDETLGEVIQDKAYGYKAGLTNLICEATDGSGVSYSHPIEVLDLLEPSIIELKDKDYVTLGIEYVPDVKFYPYISTTNQKYILEIPAEYQEYAEVIDNKVVTLKAGIIDVKVSSESNPNIFGYVKLHIEEDLFASSSIELNSTNCVTYHQEYDGRETVMVGKFKSISTPNWPAFQLKLPKPINLSKQDAFIDIKQVAGPNWSCIKFLDINKNSIAKTETGRDYEQGMNSNGKAWTTVKILGSANFTKDIHYIQIHMSPILSGTINGQPVTYEDYAIFAFDNFIVSEVPLEGFKLSENKVQIDLVTPYEVKPTLLPATTTVKAFSLRLEEGSEKYIEILEGNKIKGKALGTGVVILYSPGYENVTARLEVEVLEVIPHAGAVQILANQDNQIRLETPFALDDLFTKAISFDFKLENKEGQIAFNLNDEEPGLWFNVTDQIIIQKDSFGVHTNMGRITESEGEGWYTLTINERELHGDGRGQANFIKLCYASKSENTINGWIDFNSLKIVDASSNRDVSNISNYSSGQGSVSKRGWYRYTIAKLSVSSFAFDFKMSEPNSSITWHIFDGDHGNIEVIKDVTLSFDGETVTASRGEVIPLGDSWYTFVIPFDQFLGDVNSATHIDTFESSGVIGSVSIDWSTTRLVNR